MNKSTVFGSIAVVYVVVMTFLSLRFYDQYKYYEARVPRSAKEIETETNMLLTQLKKIMQVPDETPSVATVADNATLKKQQAFFAYAENGDKVIIFPQARKAVLYRPSVNKVIESGPLLVSPNNANQAANGSQIQPLNVAVLDGADNPTGAQSVEERLKKAAGPVINTSLGDAVSKDYTGISVVDVTGKNKQSVDDIAKFFQANVVDLPAGESRPDADVLIIVGKSE